MKWTLQGPTIMRLHGTDGIRGRIVADQNTDLEAMTAYIENGVISGRLMQLLGEASGLWLSDRQKGGGNPEVVVGWDNRPDNERLVSYLTKGLHRAGCSVVWVGEVSTPALHWNLILQKATGGCMITASHNPADNSGLKVFDSNGHKTDPNEEELITSILENILDDDEGCHLESGEPKRRVDGISSYSDMGLPKRLPTIQATFGGSLSRGDVRGLLPSHGLILDTSNGATRDWLAEWLIYLGVPVKEVSTNRALINDRCGAGELSPNGRWSFDELREGGLNHSLLDELGEIIDRNDGNPRWAVGQLVGVALDGDADRCLFVEAGNLEVFVLDGDRILDDLLRASQLTRTLHPVRNCGSEPWVVAASIESNFGFINSMERFTPAPKVFQTAVGDRWLTAALLEDAKSLSPIGCAKAPGLVPPPMMGVEDSGHIVLPYPDPHRPQHWRLVGDGVATLLAMLSARLVLTPPVDKGEGRELGEPRTPAPMSFVGGGKWRESVWGVDRSLWTGENELADEVTEIFIREMSSLSSSADEVVKVKIEGEPDILMLEGELQFDEDEDVRYSMGVRNSGTEPKISATLRTSRVVNSEIAHGAVKAVVQHLGMKMKQ